MTQCFILMLIFLSPIPKDTTLETLIIHSILALVAHKRFETVKIHVSDISNFKFFMNVTRFSQIHLNAIND
jgi:hypothetical protein